MSPLHAQLIFIDDDSHEIIATEFIRMVLLAPAASVTPFSMQFPIRLLVANVIRIRAVIINFFAKWFVAKGNKVHDYLFDQFYQGLINFKWEHKIIIPSEIKEEDLRNMNIPTLFLVGDKEIIYNHKKALSKAMKTLPNIQAVLIHGAGHALSIEKSDMVNEHILNLLMHRA
ncbi:alpha/beta hydrolase [Bacillus sp. HMF5848]|uniref:alpha/beta fold hydrolase n=1 Tax=Bacillus sp. HMF5848 TaxID=2495421 RepID=UPI000F7B81BD|nr:alpha/beta hydrolase [Bacillus sp. HMF5848]RSK26079.1 alpha/beta hydrolase [Bacillus sp. HMF5848]